MASACPNCGLSFEAALTACPGCGFSRTGPAGVVQRLGAAARIGGDARIGPLQGIGVQYPPPPPQAAPKAAAAEEEWEESPSSPPAAVPEETPPSKSKSGRVPPAEGRKGRVLPAGGRHVSSKPRPQPPPGKRRSKAAAYFLCLLFGVIGGHQFYLGKKATGVFRLLLLGGYFFFFSDTSSLFFGSEFREVFRNLAAPACLLLAAALWLRDLFTLPGQVDRVNGVVPQRGRKYLPVAYLLALPLGLLGAHQFYLGKSRAGSVRFGLFWAAVAMWFMGSDESAQEALMEILEQMNIRVVIPSSLWAILFCVFAGIGAILWVRDLVTMKKQVG